MSRDEIDLLREARPTAAGPGPGLARQVRGELMAESADTTGARWARLRRVRVAVPAVAAVVAAVVAGVLVLGRSGEVAWAAEALRVAEAAPRLLVGEPGWQVVRADEFAADQGEMTFANGGRLLELRWQPASQYEALVEDRRRSADLETTVRVEGAEADVLRYRGTSDFIAIWLVEDHTIEARGLASGPRAFEALVASLREVGVEEWLSAMPRSVVKPVDRAEVVDAMLVGITLPPGVDRSALESGDAVRDPVRDRYQLGAQVAGAVACAWIERWVAATESGDEAAARAAVDAMAASHRWPILLELDGEGDYPEVVWEYADAMATGDPIVAGKELTVAESYRTALGCPGG